MQFKILYTIIALAGAVAAQDLSNVPKCAMAPALAAFGKTGCALSNLKCLCSSTSLLPDLESAVAAVCTPDELAQVNAFAVATCKSVGITLVIPSPSSGIASATGTSSTSGNATAVASTTTTTTSSASTTSTSTTASSSTSSGTTSVSSSGSSAAATGSTTTSASQSASSSPSATAAKGAGNVVQIGGSALAGAFLFALAL